MPAEVLCRSVHMQNTASIILMKPKAEWFNYCINSSQLLNLLDPKWGEKGRFVKAVINLGFVFRGKKKFHLFFNEKVYAQVDLTWKYLKEGARTLNAQQYHCPRFAAINRQEPTTMPLQISLRLYSEYPQWRHVSILSWGNNKSCWNWILYSTCWVCSLMVQLVEWFVCNSGWFIFEWRHPVNVNKLIKPWFCFLKRCFSLLTMLCGP